MRDKWKPNLKSPFAADASTDWALHCAVEKMESMLSRGLTHDAEGIVAATCLSRYCYLACRAL